MAIYHSSLNETAISGPTRVMPVLPRPELGNDPRPRFNPTFPESVGRAAVDSYPRGHLVAERREGDDAPDNKEILGWVRQYDELLADKRARSFQPNPELLQWLQDHGIAQGWQLYGARYALIDESFRQDNSRHTLLLGLDFRDLQKQAGTRVYLTIPKEYNRSGLPVDALMPDNLADSFVVARGRASQDEFFPSVGKVYDIELMGSHSELQYGAA